MNLASYLAPFAIYHDVLVTFSPSTRGARRTRLGLLGLLAKFLLLTGWVGLCNTFVLGEETPKSTTAKFGVKNPQTAL